MPKQIIAQLTSNQDAIPLNAPCQYCGEEAKLLSIDSMKNHYSTVHNKQVIMIEQEEIIKMHNYFYCCKCKNQSTDFEQHHKHMKEAHAMKSYKCKSCILITNDVTRLKTHFKAKHLINNSGPNQQCYYCQVSIYLSGHGIMIKSGSTFNSLNLNFSIFLMKIIFRVS